MRVIILSCCNTVCQNFKLFNPSVVFKCNIFSTTTLCGSKNVLRRRPIRVISKSKKLVTTEDVDTKHPVLPLHSKLAFSRWDEHRIAKFRPEEKPPVLKYEIAKENLEKFTQVLSTVKSYKNRESSGKVMLEGIRLINDALSAGMQPEMLLFSRIETLSKLRLKVDQTENLKVYKVLYRTLQIWSSLKTSPGIIGIFKKPSGDHVDMVTQPALPITLICHNITDAGKMGTIIRSAAAVGCKSILLMKGCVDPWIHSVLRSSCGANFRIPIVSNIEWTHIVNYIPESVSLFLINNKVTSKSVDENNYTDFLDEWDVDDRLRIIDEKSFSTDTQSEKEQEENQSSEEDLIPARVRATSNGKADFIIDRTYDDRFTEKYSNVYIPKLKYTDIVFPKKDIVLFIDDNDATFDPKAQKLSCDFGGKELNIPIENNIKQLSPSVALSIVLYEIRRQIAEKYVLL